MKLAHLLFRSHLDDGEKIVFIAHSHTFLFLKASFKTFFFGLVIPALLYLVFPQFLMVFVVWGCGGIIGMIYHLVDWYFDAFLVTNSGVIDIERNGLFDRSSTRIEYHMIEGISYSIKGFWATILNFGDLTIDKVGTQTSVHLNDAASPKKIEEKILKCQDRFVTQKSFRDHNALKDMLSEMIAYHLQNNKIPNNKK